ncbi:hypothetical protein [Aquamicrobium terrae]|uniref:Uncharacterized protein n=1 Tax=Aquamicrobium terrae TaxID=1324945 RepID=A0ABV2MWY7_9HYPH
MAATSTTKFRSERPARSSTEGGPGETALFGRLSDTGLEAAPHGRAALFLHPNYDGRLFSAACRVFVIHFVQCIACAMAPGLGCTCFLHFRAEDCRQ